MMVPRCRPTRAGGSRATFGVAVLLTVLVATSLAGGCGGGIDEWEGGANPIRTLSSRRWFGDRFVGVDQWAVVICRVPVDVAAPTYEPIPDRLGIEADEIVDRLAGVADYFERWSRGRYRPEFRAGVDVAIEEDESDQDCVERALDAEGGDVDGVLVVADAQHRADVPGGWGRPGVPCVDDCPASTTRRAAYVGAADFFEPEAPPLDLVEHEMGHALDWPHSNLTDDTFDRGVYDSPFDLMSDTTAGRVFDPTTRNAPGPLAVNLLAADWLDDDEVRVVVDDSEQVLVPVDSGDSGVRLLIVPTAGTYWTVEVIAARGDNAHLGRDQVVVHRVEVGPNGETGVARRQILAVSDLVEGETFVGDQTSVSVLAVDDERWTVRVRTTG